MAMPMWCACNLKNIEPLQLIMIIQSWLYFTLKLYTINTVYDENNFLKKIKKNTTTLFNHSTLLYNKVVQGHLVSLEQDPIKYW